MAPHHKSNRAVEGNPDRGHNRGMPRRPDDEELAELTAQDRRGAGLPGVPAKDAESVYREAMDEIERQVRSGDIPTGNATRRGRAPFPPSRYEG
ncbi:hypothetical protein [Streptomyces sp. NPDC058964]|uniref:hypothetical protein n=1 Tax=Streptomyces sp. NPDC058964 TaxID=3346681 RepID=UPI0036C4816C